MPNRCDMHDDVRALREHGRQKRAIKPDGRHQVQAELLLPVVVTRRGEATGARARRASTFTTMAMPARRVSSRSRLMAKFAVG